MRSLRDLPLGSGPLRAVLVLFLLPSPARADVLVPATFIVYGYVFALHLVPAALLIETIIARRILRLSLIRSLLLACVANVVSAVVGLLIVVPTTIWMNVRGSLESGAVLIILLCVPLCPLSIWIEGRVAARLLRRSHTREVCARWAREANLASYLMMAAVSFVLIAASWVCHARGLI